MKARAELIRNRTNRRRSGGGPEGVRMHARGHSPHLVVMGATNHIAAIALLYLER
jgi:hypothetical protein